MNLQEKGGTAYKPTTIERKTEFGFSTGKPVFILDDPQGKSWVMKSANLMWIQARILTSSRILASSSSPRRAGSSVSRCWKKT